ncbi:MAG: preprotein translocase subunit SecA [Planctomycetes bacterium]|nr:preprotein translocase subunit SecA [Planctomycetota bacterium]
MPILDSVTTMVKRVLGTSNEAMIRRLLPTVDQVKRLEPEMQAADDIALRARSAKLRDRVAKGASLEAVMIEALALAREVADRRLGMWNALDPKNGFPEDGWGDSAATVSEVRGKLAAAAAAAAARTAADAKGDGDAAAKPLESWDLDLPAACYAQIRKLYPQSLPPFRMRAHDVQVLGAIVLHQGRIAEMRTGEGKTLVASLTCYLNALSGKGVHVITVNDYLALRDSRWNSPTLRFLGCTVGAIQSQMPSWVRKQVYALDVVYGTNNEFGFDYLRDNLARSLDEQVQTRRTFAVIDEADSVLIDEARTPLIISGPAVGRKEYYEKSKEVATALAKGPDYEVDIKDRHVTLTEDGMDKAAKQFGVSNLYDAENMHLPHFLDNALKAKELYLRDKEYLVVQGQVKIVDEHTGRTMEGRRWSDGLHQAIEAKEGVPVQEENQTYATITLQNFFRLYDKLSGMTGTAMTEAAELSAIYKLDVVAVPPNRKVARADLADLIYGSEKEKFEAIIKEVEDLHAIGQPVLVGTISVEVSERLSELFKQKGIPHNVLNARQHQREAEIVANAGQFGAVTIATNMAGRGTDIILGKISSDAAFKHWQNHQLVPKRLRPDSPELDEATIDLWTKHYLGEEDAAKLTAQAKSATPAGKLKGLNDRRREAGFHPLPMPSALTGGVDVRQLGGLRIVGTERHESRRIDNQLRGRSGRQGDPGSSRFYLSLDDDLMKRFAGPMMAGMMRKMGLKDGVPIESPMVSRAVEKAQKRVEEFHYGIRKNLLEYDQVMNSQRTMIYRQRNAVLAGKDLEKTLLVFYRDAIDDLIQRVAADGTRGPELAKKICDEFTKEIGIPAPQPEALPVKDGGDECLKVLYKIVTDGIDSRKTEFGQDVYDTVMRLVLLDTIDRRWKDHLYAMDHLRHAIGLEGYAQKDPRMRYKEEGYKLFLMMNELIRADVAKMFFRLQVQVNAPEGGGPSAELDAGGFKAAPGLGKPASARTQQAAAAAANAGEGLPPNPGMGNRKPAPGDQCPCGSGRTFKQCHGK